MELEVLGVDHLYVTVSDLARAERFYDPIFRALGFRKGTLAIGGEPHLHYFNRVMQYTLRPARGDGAERAEPYRVGSLHHLCFRVASPSAVDSAYELLCELGAGPSTPRLYPEYRPDYYATFFDDPDGIRLEIVSDTQGRRLTRERWEELTDFVDPVRKLLARDAAPISERRPDGNVWRAPAPEHGELHDELARVREVRVERIVSSQLTGSEPYDQAQDEWVALLRGQATLELAGELVRLTPGDYVMIAARTPHRVLATSEGALWLAVHVEPASKVGA